MATPGAPLSEVERGLRLSTDPRSLNLTQVRACRSAPCLAPARAAWRHTCTPVRTRTAPRAPLP